MKLEKLKKENIQNILKKKIYCYEKSESYLRELCDKYDVCQNIVAIVDDSKRNQGKLFFRGRVLPILDGVILNQWDDTEAVLLITSDYYKEAFDRLCKIPGLKDNIGVIYYFANYETETEEYYRKKYEDCELQNMIVFRSGPHASSYVRGMDFADNARALFEYMLRNNYQEKYELIWVVKNPKDFSAYQEIKNVSFVGFDWSVSENPTERDAYYRALCLAKFLFFTDAYGFARNCRKDQIRVQLWHGCGFKSRVNFVRCEKRYEYNTVASELYARIHRDLFGLREDQLLITGLAKQDWVFQPIDREKLVDIGIPEAEKYILWLPTFRTTEKKLSQLNEYHLNTGTGLPVLDGEEKLEQLNDVLQRSNMVMIIKLHPFQNREDIKCEGYSNIVLLNNAQLVDYDIQINQLMGWADALISDYSSAVIDYMLLDRPIAFLLEDMEEYGGSRGFVFDDIRKWLPGKEVFSYEEFMDFVKENSKGEDLTKDKRHHLTSVMHRYHDDRSCERILDVLKIRMVD